MFIYIWCFKKNLYIYEQNSSDSFYSAILYSARFKLTEKNDFLTDQKEIVENISKRLIWSVYFVKKG